MPTPVASLRLNLRALAGAAALALSAIAVTATAGPAWGAAVQADEDFHFILFGSGDNSSSMNSTSDDYQRASALRGPGRALLYFRHNGAAYVIRDPDVLRRADALFAPQRALGERQAALGRQQAGLGAQQAQLGAQQARIGARQADATPRQMAELSRQQAALGGQQGELGQRQAALGDRQADLGREQARLSGIATANLRNLVGEALQRGLAQRVD